jgi:hypothetical protein
VVKGQSYPIKYDWHYAPSGGDGVWGHRTVNNNRCRGSDANGVVQFPRGEPGAVHGRRRRRKQHQLRLLLVPEPRARRRAPLRVLAAAGQPRLRVARHQPAHAAAPAASARVLPLRALSRGLPRYLLFFQEAETVLPELESLPPK